MPSTIAATLLLAVSALVAMSHQIQGKVRGILAVILVFGGLIASVAVPALHRHRVPTHHLLRYIPDGPINITGHLSRPVERKSGETPRPRIYLEVERATIRGVKVPMTGTVRITLASRLEKIPQVGDRLLIRRIRLKPPPRFRNPGAFDYREFLRLRGVHAVAYGSVRKVHLLAAGEKWAWRRHLFKFREKMSAHIHGAYSGRVARLIEAMTIGLRDEIGKELKSAFQRSGAAHLLAISGLHVGFIAAFCFFALQGVLLRVPPRFFPLHPILLTPSKLAAAGVIPLVILFALLSGARISTVRAAIMIIAYLLTRLLERPGTVLHSVMLAALLILLIEPGYIWDVGFQLSFVAVSAIILAADRLPRPDARLGFWDRERWWVRARQLAIIQLVVTAAVTPLTALHFHQAHPIGLIVNFLLIPAASLLVPLSFLTSAVATTMPAGWEVLLAPATWLAGGLAQFMIFVSTASAKIPWATYVTPKPETWLIVSIFSFLALALRSRRARWRQGAWAGVCCLTLFLLLPDADPRSPLPRRTTLLLPDSGEVDAFFLRLPDGKGLVVDGTGKRAGSFSIWGQVLAPLMRREHELHWNTMLVLSQYPKSRLAANDFASGIRIQTTHRISDLSTPLSGRSRTYRSRFTRWGRPRVIWRMSGGGAQVSLHSWRKGAMGLEVKNRRSRWLLMLPSKYPAFDPHWFAGKKYDLVRLPEGLLRKSEVLDWLEANPPKVILAAPQRVKWQRPDVWQETRRRQRNLGVYRPWRGGMLRVSAGAERGTARLTAKRFRVAEAWPESDASRWSTFRYRLGRESPHRARGDGGRRRDGKKDSAISAQ